MPSKEIKELRQSGKLEEALNLAKSELAVDSSNIWCKRNISWVYYEYFKQTNPTEQFDQYINWLREIKDLQLPVEEKILFEQLSWQLGKAIFSLQKENAQESERIIQLFDEIKSIEFPKPNEGYSYLFKSLHKALKNTDRYHEFVDWWSLINFMPQDFQKEKLPNGKEIMSVAEQTYIAYAKQLLPKHTLAGEIIFDQEKAKRFLPILSNIVENNPQFQYPAYYNAKLLLALGDNENLLETLLPFAKKKRNDFWVWVILSEAFPNEPDKIFSCYCKALLCKSPEEMLVSLRQKIAAIMISRKHYNEARTEIDLLVQARNNNDFKIPSEVEKWKSQEWYINATAQVSNTTFYKEYAALAESLLFSDTPEETIIVEFVNSDKKILNFIASETKFGFLKYDRFFKKIEIGDILKVRFQSGSNESMHQIYTAFKVEDEDFRKQYVKDIEGEFRIIQDKSFGFVDDIFVHPSLIQKNGLKNGDIIKCMAIKSYNPAKKQLSWKVANINKKISGE